MGIFSDKIEAFYSEYKKPGLFGKKYIIGLSLYADSIEGEGFTLYQGVLSDEPQSFSIPLEKIIEVYTDSFCGNDALCIKYETTAIIKDSSCNIVVLPNIDDFSKWKQLINSTRQEVLTKLKLQQDAFIASRQEQEKLQEEKEEKAMQFFKECYAFHIKDDTPSYQLFAEKNKIATIYLDDNKALNFLKIDGYTEEESNGIIEYKNIHYFEKAGSISYVADIKGNYSCYGGSFTGANFSKLASIGGGLLFGLMGMALGTALTYKPAQSTPTQTSFSIDSDVKKIDDRNVLLNFYSDMKRQYVDIELPQDIYNFFQTYLPEKKYSIVDELEKKTVLHQSESLISQGTLLRTSSNNNESIETKNSLSTDDFKVKIEKLNMLKEAKLLSEEEFENERKKLLSQI